MKVKKTRWTKKDDALLLEFLSSTMFLKEIADRMGRTESAVWARMRRLGVKREKEDETAKDREKRRVRRISVPKGVRERKLDEDVKERIRSLYPDTRNKEIADALGMGLDELAIFARSEGLRKTPAFVISERRRYERMVQQFK